MPEPAKIVFSKIIQDICSEKPVTERQLCPAHYRHAGTQSLSVAAFSYFSLL